MTLSERLDKIITANQKNIKIINHTNIQLGTYIKDEERIKFLFFCELCNKPLYQIKHDNGQQKINSWATWLSVNTNANETNNVYPDSAYIYPPSYAYNERPDPFIGNIDQLIQKELPNS